MKVVNSLMYKWLTDKEYCVCLVDIGLSARCKCGLSLHLFRF